MTYAIILLLILAALGWSVWNGTLPDITVPGFDQGVRSAAEDIKVRARAAIREAVRRQLHSAVDEALK